GTARGREAISSRPRYHFDRIKKGPPEHAGRPFYSLCRQGRRVRHLVGGVLGSVRDRFTSVLDCFTSVRDFVASGVERVVDGGRSVGSGLGSVLDSGVISGVLGLGFARGKAEREDRNGQCNLLHDRSIPCLWGAAFLSGNSSGSASRKRQASGRKY